MDDVFVQVSLEVFEARPFSSAKELVLHMAEHLLRRAVVDAVALPGHALHHAAHSLGIRILFELGKRAPHRAVPALSWDSSRRLRPRRGAPHT